MPGRNMTPPLSEKENKYVQKFTEKFLFYGRAVDLIMITALSSIASQKSAPTAATMKQVNHYLDYCAFQEDAIMTFQKSDMKLARHINAEYLNNPKTCSRSGRHY